MNETQFDTLVRTAAGRVRRRDAIKALVGAGLGLAFTSAGWDRTRGLLTGPPAVGAAEQQAGSCYSSPDAAGFLPNDGRFAETLVATTSGKLSRIQLEVTKPANTTGDFLVRLLAVNANGTPTNKVLAKATIRDTDVSVGGAVTVNAHFKKRKTVALKAGKRYAVAVSRPGGDGIGVPTAVNGCIDKQLFYSDTKTAPFTEMPGPDMLVALFVGF
jgi:hypothetical protein